MSDKKIRSRGKNGSRHRGGSPAFLTQKGDSRVTKRKVHKAKKRFLDYRVYDYLAKERTQKEIQKDQENLIREFSKLSLVNKVKIVRKHLEVFGYIPERIEIDHLQHLLVLIKNRHPHSGVDLALEIVDEAVETNNLDPDALKEAVRNMVKQSEQNAGTPRNRKPDRRYLSLVV